MEKLELLELFTSLSRVLRDVHVRDKYLNRAEKRLLKKQLNEFKKIREKCKQRDSFHYCRIDQCPFAQSTDWIGELFRYGSLCDFLSVNADQIFKPEISTRESDLFDGTYYQICSGGRMSPK